MPSINQTTTLPCKRRILLPLTLWEWTSSRLQLLRILLVLRTLLEVTIKEPRSYLAFKSRTLWMCSMCRDLWLHKLLTTMVWVLLITDQAHSKILRFKTNYSISSSNSSNNNRAWLRLLTCHWLPTVNSKLSTEMMWRKCAKTMRNWLSLF